MIPHWQTGIGNRVGSDFSGRIPDIRHCRISGHDPTENLHHVNLGDDLAEEDRLEAAMPVEE